LRNLCGAIGLYSSQRLRVESDPLTKSYMADAQIEEDSAGLIRAPNL
jgi:hypothetical protein